MDHTVQPMRPVTPALLGVLRREISPAFAMAALAAAYFLLWLFRRTYSALDDDAQLYAFLALSRLNPSFRTTDLFLAYGSQDQYTLFAPLYAWAIQQLGLATAESCLTLLFQCWSLTAAWFIAQRFVTSRFAWLAVGVLIMVPGYYGSHWVFEYAEPFLTARLPAEALILSAVALFLADKKLFSWGCVILAFLIHPIVSVPGAALLLLLKIPEHLRWRLIGIGFASLGLLAIAALLESLPPALLMDGDWLEVVRERTFFMFLETWQARDWDWMLLTLLTLGFASKVSSDPRTKAICILSAVIGVAGVLLAGITSLAPLAIVLKGQPWRWMWFPTYMAVLTMVPTVVACWRSGAIARYSCLLLYAAWVFPISWALPNTIAAPVAGLAFLIFVGRDRIAQKYVKYCKWLSISVAAAAIITVAVSTALLLSLTFTTNREPLVLERMRDVLSLGLPGILAVVLLWTVTVRGNLAVGSVSIAALSCVALLALIPRTHDHWVSSPYEHAHPSFAEWRSVLDQRRSVFWERNAVGPWLLLDSPSYLTTSQSAGVVFSRATALEVKRRANNLAPLAGHSNYGISRNERGPMNPLTVSILRKICADPLLGYVVNTAELDLPYLKAPKGRWAGLNLYSCDVALSHR